MTDNITILASAYDLHTIANKIRAALIEMTFRSTEKRDSLYNAVSQALQSDLKAIRDAQRTMQQTSLTRIVVKQLISTQL